MMPASQEAFGPFHQSLWQAPYIDLSAGYEAYVADHKRRHSGRWFATLRRLQRKIEREVGPLRFTFHSEDPRDFETIIRLKTEQFHHYNNLNDPAYMALFRHLLATPTPRCSVGVSVLHVGDRFIAGQIALGSQSMLGPIVTSYDPAVARYSPGSLLMIKVCEEAAARGIVKYDLSGGEQAYKSTWMSDADRLADGYVAPDRLTAAQRSIEAAYRRRKYHLLNHGALGPDRRLGRAVRDIRGRMPTRSSA
jgi:CelD/BcsL family acetyltransferase involved in cellulose biosynthesis